MKILALEKNRPGVSNSDFKIRLQAEARAAQRNIRRRPASRSTTSNR